MHLDESLKDKFREILYYYHRTLWNVPLSDEIDFIDRTVRFFGNYGNINLHTQQLTTRSEKIHPTPQVMYYPNGFQNVNPKYQIEMGDILYIFKHRVNGIVRSRRAVVVQVKFTKEKKRRWAIKLKQFRFLCEWHPFNIVSPMLPGNHHLYPEARSWAMYTFVGPNFKYPVNYSAKRIRDNRGDIPQGGSFTFWVQPYYDLDIDSSFFMKFIQGLRGENLLTNHNIAQFINQLYIYMDWLPDPPGDLQWDGKSFKDKKSLGVVEFTLDCKIDE